ncbi:hypothetical protein RWH45_09875 [Microbacterium sp. KSW4-17]|uniref:Uncharacterized protein n=1 Tax=Microbacterium galbum TaxID=3075994 RepID=A0ABU3T837_9MICO|nr:hypothetical protein [Microbacterium sp. KSW4-17]MDU0367526.1 hypothetical protein [Microbacterium sp. KSW4-17]
MPRIDDDDELATLRRRAYAPGADISADPSALERLIELEQRAADRDGGAADDRAAPDGEQTEPEAASVGAEAGGEDGESARPARRRMPRLRRSTVVMLAGAGLVVATLLTALVLVQRVQTDPLQVGATQVARLTEDPSFDIPSSLYRGITGNVKAYTAFEGFRVISYPSFRAGEGAARCMTVYQPDLLDTGDDAFSYDGQFLLPSCAAGPFPATFTILLAEDTPEREPTDLPADTSLQFVYDQGRDEIVVFRG